jgi:hypothetical protein
MPSEEDRPTENVPPDHDGSGSGDACGSDEAPQEAQVSDEAPESGGSARFQDPATAKPRPATVGEARARAKAIRLQEEAEEGRLSAEANREKVQRLLIGGAAVVGVVGVVAALNWPSDHVNAQCVQEDSDGQPVIVSDYYCNGHSPGYAGFFYYGGHSYRYYYGSSGQVGSRPIGGTTVAPKGATITTHDGTTIQRGGLGSRFGGSGS